ncbi:MAG: TatD family hydrolase [Planctomycetes bacterium]|nr:TatD family hydrolase [Planctomycetota bacterium]
MIKIIDPHSHMFSRTTGDYARMAQANIKVVVEPSFWLGSERQYAESYWDYFHHLITFEAKRAEKFGIKHFTFVGINAKEANAKKIALKAISGLSKYMNQPTVLGIGEIGFDKITDAEEDVFRRQLALAEENKLPVIIHTPHQDKPKGTERICKIIEDMKLTKEKIVVDHNTEETIGITKGLKGVWAGHTIYPTKLSPERVIKILRKYGTDKMLINSSADWDDSDPLAVPKTVEVMKKEGFSEAEIRQVVYDNPVAFFKQSPAFKI